MPVVDAVLDQKAGPADKRPRPANMSTKIAPTIGEAAAGPQHREQAL